MRVLAVIPARFASTRFPGKPLALINGRPMIEHVFEACRNADCIHSTIVATEDERIASVVNEFGGVVEMTSSSHQTGTDRAVEVAERHPEFDIILNVQGDQPFATPEMLTELLTPWRNGAECDMTTLACPFRQPEDVLDPNSVKVICAVNMRALYFSRAPIPYYREQHKAPVFHHLGLYGFRRRFLMQYGSLQQTPLEKCEQLEQLRVLENGFRIDVALVDKPTLEINTPEDLEKANAGN